MLARTKYPTAANNGDLNTIIQEQRKAVYHVFGNNTSTAETYDWDADPQGLKEKGGIYTNVANATAYLVGEAEGEETFSGYATPYSEAKLLQFLLDGHAVARLYGWGYVTLTPPETMESIIEVLENSDPNLGGHVNVIKKAEWSTEYDCYVYTVYDPSYDEQLEYTYSELLCNVENNNGRYKVSFWFPTVVTKTEYSSQGILLDVLGFDYSS